MMLQLRTASLPAFAILTIVINAIVYGVPVHSQEPEQFFKLPDLKSAEDSFDTSRLIDLLRLKQTLSGDYPAHFVDLESQQQHESSETDDDVDVSKRVFCNGFTGCGGRFRGRRRQQQTETENLRKRHFPYALDKRPFCNQMGCFNGGRKRSVNAIDEQVADNVSTESAVSAEIYAFPKKVKKLFCNGYGGCQNLGKRDSRLSSSVESEEGTLSPKRIRSLIRIAEAKRFFAGGYDKAMNGLIKSARKQ